MNIRVVVLAIGHPDYEKGGADGAAYSLFNALKSSSGVTPFFVAPVSPDNLGHAGPIGMYAGREDEIAINPPPVDYFRMATKNFDLLERLVDELVTALQPDVVHITHFLHIGAEVISLFAQKHQIPCIVTFNEYTSICNHNGQMITTDNRLCYLESPQACNRCFPALDTGRFFSRKRFLLHHLSYAKRYIAPSPFLKSRFVTWGLPPECVDVIGYIQGTANQQWSKPKPKQDADRIRLGYFGRFSPYKGVDVLLNAIGELPKEIQQHLELLIYGANLENESDSFQNAMRGLIDQCGSMVSLQGAYSHGSVLELMSEMDWVVVPSIWWEVGPIVIEEAFAAGVPVIASNLAGMAEKVAHGENGYLFRAGSILDLKDTIALVMSDEGQLKIEPTCAATINKDRLGRHLKAYRQSMQQAVTS